LFCALSRGLISLLLTLTRLEVVFIFVNFSFALFTPPLGDYQHFLGLVEYAGVIGPAYTFDRYIVAPDAVDRDDMEFNNKAERVKQ
jgi:hypothetical protein